ncbi:MAG: sulfite exporter TauE/SafE family protein [Candidatus Eremiobacteraeota bacterium]|nr:sulfite exporter TauE/SafE family protein [Candidatus Eremiobacteraeota bacterium]MBV8282560.1 sulfite exporter TauE/SafE family protein [Candidatus Eremiobacteraeota bacterium]
MSPLEIILFIILGALLGWLGGLFGIGGGLIAISILGIAFGMDQQHAQGTSLVMVVPTVLIGLYHYWRRGGMDARVIALMALTAGAMTYFFARLAVALPSTPLRRAFAVFLIVLALYYAWRGYSETRGGESRKSVKPMLPWPFTGLIGLTGGALSGLFTVGGAVFSVPALTLLFGYAQTVAQGMGLALVLPSLLFGLVVYGGAGDIRWPVGLALAAGSVLTVSWGVSLAHRLPEAALKYGFSVVLLLTAGLLWLRA